MDEEALGTKLLETVLGSSVLVSACPLSQPDTPVAVKAFSTRPSPRQAAWRSPLLQVLLP